MIFVVFLSYDYTYSVICERMCDIWECRCRGVILSAIVGDDNLTWIA